MERGTTPVHTFTMPMDTGTLAKVRVIYVQNGKRVLTRDDGVLLGNAVSVRLTQSETFMFDHNKPVEIQVRALTKSGDVLNSEIYKVSVGKCLDTEVLR